MNTILQEIVQIIRDGCKDQRCKNCHFRQYKHGVGCGEMYRAMKIYDLVKHSVKEMQELEDDNNE